MRRRTGFTITELLVATALILFIMAILAEAFVAGLTTFRNMKAIGDMNARLRAVESMMGDDLRADHFEGKRRTSDPGFWLYGPPQEGYLRIWHGSSLGSASFYTEGNPDGIDSYYATDHYLQLTAKKRGNNRGDYYTANLLPHPNANVLANEQLLLGMGTPDSRYQEAGSNALNSQWAEIAYFLRPNGASAGGLPLFTLYRRQRVVAPFTTNVVSVGNPPPTQQLMDLNYQTLAVNPPPSSVQPNGLPLAVKPYLLELSTSISAQGTLYFNSPRDLTVPERRFGMNQFLPAKIANYAGGIPLRSDNTLRYPVLALNSVNYVSPNYLADDEDNAAAIAGNGNSSLSSEGNDVILTDVISFAVIPIFSGIPLPDIDATGQSLNPTFSTLGVHVFDTWSNRADEFAARPQPPNTTYDYTIWNDSVNDPAHMVPNTSVLTGIQISIRVWDTKTQQARQITIIQDL
jgi:type II secretory pathway pseudopilin PulG